MEDAIGTAEITYLAWSVILLVVYIVVQAVLAMKDTSLPYLASDRLEGRAYSPACQRATAALRNFVETYGAFVALALANVVTGQAGGLSATGAMIWFWARVVYLPVYVVGIAWVRTLVWAISLIGLALMLVPLFG